MNLLNMLIKVFLKNKIPETVLGKLLKIQSVKLQSSTN